MRFTRHSSLAGALSFVLACSSDAGSRPGREDHDAASTDAGDDAAALPSDSGTKPIVRRDAGQPDDAGVDASRPEPEPWGPGPMPWEVVPEAQVLETCRLDPEALAAADELLNTPWAVIRYGKLCHQYMAEGMKARQAWSATKTLGALVTGMVSYETRNLPKQLTDADPVKDWLDSFTYNPDAKIAHVLAMIAHNESLAYGQRKMEYDTVGSVQINTLADIMSLALAQDSERLGPDLEQFTQHFLFDKLGMAHFVWTEHGPKKILGFSWQTDVYDMAKLGQLMLRGGVWNGERLLESEWIYRMTHPAFEDANTGYGYLTWLNASSGWSIGADNLPGGAALPDLLLGPVNPGPCAPVAIYAQHPHGLSEAPSCLYDFPYSCAQTYDVGVWQAIGLAGQVVQGRPASTWSSLAWTSPQTPRRPRTRYATPYTLPRSCGTL